MAFEEISKALQNDLRQVEDMMRALSDVPSIPIMSEVLTYLLQNQGKRIRPLLMLLNCPPSTDLHRAAAAIELIHTATLLHDDVIDHAPLRRGQDTVHRVWNPSVSILMGDFLFANAFGAFVEFENPEILKMITRTAKDLAKGELLQLSEGFDLRLSRETYLDIISMKTGSLFEAALGISTILSKGSVSLMMHAGKNFGIAFQIIDDILDYITLKKSDFREGKITLPLIMAREQGIEIPKEHTDPTFLLKDIFPMCYDLADLFLEQACQIIPSEELKKLMRALIQRKVT